MENNLDKGVNLYVGSASDPGNAATMSASENATPGKGKKKGEGEGNLKTILVSPPSETNFSRYALRWRISTTAVKRRKCA